VYLASRAFSAVVASRFSLSICLRARNGLEVGEGFFAQGALADTIGFYYSEIPRRGRFRLRPDFFGQYGCWRIWLGSNAHSLNASSHAAWYLPAARTQPSLRLGQAATIACQYSSSGERGHRRKIILLADLFSAFELIFRRLKQRHGMCAKSQTLFRRPASDVGFNGEELAIFYNRSTRPRKRFGHGLSKRYGVRFQHLSSSIIVMTVPARAGQAQAASPGLDYYFFAGVGGFGSATGNR
jgi:hypothetical protein